MDGKIRFGLVKFEATIPEGFSEESTKSVFVSHEVSDDWENPTRFEDEEFKGLKFARKPLKGKERTVSEMF